MNMTHFNDIAETWPALLRKLSALERRVKALESSHRNIPGPTESVPSFNGIAEGWPYVLRVLSQLANRVTLLENTPPTPPGPGPEPGHTGWAATVTSLNFFELYGDLPGTDDVFFDALTSLNHFYLWGSVGSSMTRLAFPVLSYLDDYFRVDQCSGLTTVELPVAQLISGMVIKRCAALTSLVLTSVTFDPRWNATPWEMDLHDNALNETTVNDLLVRLAASAWFMPGAYLDLTGGTNAAPTGAGAAAKASMQAAGATIDTN